MRVLVIAEWIRPEGGISSTLLELLRQLTAERAEVSLLLLRPTGEERTLVPAGVQLIYRDTHIAYAPAGAALVSLLRSRRPALAIAFVANLAKSRVMRTRHSRLRFLTNTIAPVSERYDITAAYSMLDNLSIQYAADKTQAAVKVMWCHTDPSMYGVQTLNGMDRTFQVFQFINCVSKSCRLGMRSRFPSLTQRLRVRYNPIDAAAIRLKSLEAGPRPSVAISLCTVGRLSHEKGIDLIVDVAHRLERDGVNYRWWIVGPDHDPAYAAHVREMVLESGLSERIEFVGKKENPYPYMAACDIYVQPSRFEGYCTTTAEAKILARPIVTTRVSGADEQFTHGVDGSIVDIAPHALYNAIIDLINQPDLRDRYERACSSQKLGGIGKQTAYTYYFSEPE